MDDLIRFVFADENDTYYRDDLTALDLNEYLWFDLHKKYSCVYYLTERDGSFEVSTFGDVKGRKYQDDRGISRLFAKNDNRLAKWMQEQLRSKEPVAFVCSLEEFCRVCDSDPWPDILERLAADRKRTGEIVLTAPVTAEDSAPLLLKSKALAACDTAVRDLRSGKEYPIYGHLQRSKPRSCQFLNRFTAETVYPVVLRAMFTDGDRNLTDADLDRLSNFLVSYLNSPQSWDEMNLFDFNLPPEYMTFEDLYAELKKDRVWEKAVELSETNSLQIVPNPAEPAILRDKNSWAGKLYLERVPKSMRKYEDEAKNADRILAELRRQLLTPKNRDENESILRKIDELYYELHRIDGEDVRTYTQILMALRYCVGQIYTEPYGEKNRRVHEVIEQLNVSIRLSENLSEIDRNIRLTGNQSGRFTEMTLRNMTAARAAKEKKLREFQDILNASILSSTFTADSDIDSQELMDALNNINRELESISEPEPEPQPQPEPEPEPEEREYELDDYSMDFIPPNYN